MNETRQLLENKAYALRVGSLKASTAAGSGHPTSSLSSADLVAALFFYAMRYDPRDFTNPNSDRFILSKGHASPLLYAAWREVGIISEEELLTYRQFSSALEGHPTFRFSHTEAATGSLGIGLSIGLGMALAARLNNFDYRTYVLMGDSEIAEGSVWEAAELAAKNKTDKLIALVDVNALGQSTKAMHEHHMDRYAEKFHAFGWKTIVIDGHDMHQIIAALDKAHENTGQPTVILARTIKGHGVASVEGRQGYHGRVFSKEETPALLDEMRERFALEAAFVPETAWQPTLPLSKPLSFDAGVVLEMPQPTYKIGQMEATRKAYGLALRELGKRSKAVVALDAEVKNSTYAELFEEKYPERFIQCYIAEQNMVSMAVGLALREFIPFASTFAAFFSRAFDQVRMAAIGSSNIRLVGSHAGVSIGQDGPSQMGLEDIALMRALPGSVVLYPSDAVSTYKLVEQMANHFQGISYLRTTRGQTPVIYQNTESFPIGGCKVLHQSESDEVCIIAAGITLHEAQVAWYRLQNEGIAVRVIDLYSIKPLDEKTVIACALACGKKVITVEDHYLQGGLGQAVTYAVRNHGVTLECLAVTQLPRSGTPEELLAWAGIDANAIADAVKKMVKK